MLIIIFCKLLSKSLASLFASTVLNEHVSSSTYLSTLCESVIIPSERPSYLYATSLIELLLLLLISLSVSSAYSVPQEVFNFAFQVCNILFGEVLNVRGRTRTNSLILLLLLLLSVVIKLPEIFVSLNTSTFIDSDGVSPAVGRYGSRTLREGLII